MTSTRVATKGAELAAGSNPSRRRMNDSRSALIEVSFDSNHTITISSVALDADVRPIIADTVDGKTAHRVCSVLFSRENWQGDHREQKRKTNRDQVAEKLLASSHSRDAVVTALHQTITIRPSATTRFRLATENDFGVVAESQVCWKPRGSLDIRRLEPPPCAVTNREHPDRLSALIDFIYDPVHVRFLAVEQVPQFSS